MNSRDKNVTDRKLQARIDQRQDSTKRDLVELGRADLDTSAVLPGRVDRLQDKITKVKQQMRALEAIGEPMKAAGDGQNPLTDRDARSMAASGRGTGIVGYNVQTAVDASRQPRRCQRPGWAECGPWSGSSQHAAGGEAC